MHCERGYCGVPLLRCSPAHFRVVFKCQGEVPGSYYRVIKKPAYSPDRVLRFQILPTAVFTERKVVGTPVMLTISSAVQPVVRIISISKAAVI